MTARVVSTSAASVCLRAPVSPCVALTTVRVAAGVALAALAALAPARGQGLATPDRLAAPGFWPTKEAARSEFVGTAACAGCHPGPAATQAQTSMARTLARAADKGVLPDHASLAVRLAGHDYRLELKDHARVLAVAKDGRSLEQPLGWAFGAGRIGQTFVYERGGAFHESRVSYLGALAGLAFTPKRALDAPRDLDEALGRPIPHAEALRCFGCHGAATTKDGGIDQAGLIPGVTCETCHGPGARHVAAVREERVEEIPHSVLRPSRSDPGAAVDFCGACHATWWDVTLAGEKGIAALRSQPYRLQSSACWVGEGDPRLTCTACHDPHRPAERDPLAYDGRCLACHEGASQAGAKPADPQPDGATPATRRAGPKACSVGTSRCVTCHMPKYEVEEMRFSFTDHLIRVVKDSNPRR